MESPELQHLLQNLDYGHIYVIGNPKQTTNLRWFASMIEPMIRPLSLQWVETWHVDHTVIAARRFNVGNMGQYATCNCTSTGTAAATVTRCLPPCTLSATACPT